MELAMTNQLKKTDDEWRKELTPIQFSVTRRAATEAPFTGEYDKTSIAGVYRCICCGEILFDSDAKFDSGSGWPSFTKPFDPERLLERPDHSDGRIQTEVICSKCDAHLGHVINDGPAPTGLRYCINSAALKLEPNCKIPPT